MQKGQTGILIIVGILVLVAVASGAYFLGKSSKIEPAKVVSKPQITTEPTPISQASPADEMANWKTYISEFGYSFKYPTNFWITVVQTSKPGVATIGDAPPGPENTVASLEIRQGTIDEKFNLDARMADHLRTYSEYKVLGQKNTQVATYPARYIEATVNNKYPIILVLVQKDNSYSVLLEAASSSNKITSSQLKSTFNQILSTFRFTN